jgi:hypothetical protein
MIENFELKVIRVAVRMRYPRSYGATGLSLLGRLRG